MTNSELTDEALEAFWEVVVKHFPQATTGDLSPMRTIELSLAAEAAIEEWISNNVLPNPPKESKKVTCCDADLETLDTYLDHNHVKLDGYCFVALSPDRQTLFSCPELADGTPEPSDSLQGHLNWGEVTAPENQEFLDAVNLVFGTAFCYDDFAGR